MRSFSQAGSAQAPRQARLPGQDAAGRRRTAWAAAARRNWLAAVLFAAGLALRVLTQLAYRPALFYIDTPRYLYNAYGMDPVGYKGPLRVIALAGGFGAVAAVQHLLGLGMAVVIYLLARRRGAPRWLAALAMAPVLLDAYQLQIEQMVMPDTWFEALIVAGLAILAWKPGAGWRAVLAGGAVLGSSALVAQVGEALILPAVLYALAAGGGWRQAIGKAAATGAAFALPILAYCTGSYMLTGAFSLSHTGVTSLYGRMAAAADCATLRLPSDERAMCPARAEQRMGPDWLEYAQGSPVRRYYRMPSRAQADSLISDFNHRVLSQQPARVLGAYGRDAVKLFMLSRTTGQGDTPISRWQFQDRFPTFSPYVTVRDSVVRFADYTDAGQLRMLGTGTRPGASPQVTAPLARFLRAYQLDGGYTPGPLLLFALLAGLAGTAAVLRRRPGPAARQTALACLLFWISAVAVIGASDVFEFSWRYQLPALVTLVPAGALGIAILIRPARDRRGTVPGAAGTG